MSQYGTDRSDAQLNSAMSGARPPNAVPRLEEPFRMSRDTSMGGTPDVSAEIEDRLHLGETTTEDEEDSLADDDSSVDEGTLPVVMQGLAISRLPTGLCYDERMRYHSEVSATTGENVHPEDPRRIYFIFKELKEAGLVAYEDDKSNLLVDLPLLRIDAREATEEECCLVHTQTHYDFVKRTSSMSLEQYLQLEASLTYPFLALTDEELIDLSEDIHMDSIYFNALSFFSGRLSAGGAIETCRAVVSRKVKSTMGFCLFNNVCIASRVCQNDFGEQCRKILILDW
jgi:histone deacetylase 6